MPLVSPPDGVQLRIDDMRVGRRIAFGRRRPVGQLSSSRLRQKSEQVVVFPDVGAEYKWRMSRMRGQDLW